MIGVRLGGLGAITLRSVCGVNANAGRPGIELLGGVVSGLVVVRSGLSTQVASASRLPSAFRTFSQVGAACAANGTSNESASAIALTRPKFVKRFIRVPLCVTDRLEE